ncbi:MAG TPA: MFS transporter [Gaiellaceae bacterium]|nr:MFS transporter [Gaiellaceae bacterium]
MPRLGPLAEREFGLLFGGQLVSLLGTAVAPIALAFAVLDLTGSKTDLGLVLAANWAPQLALILFGGVFADRLPRHLVMVGSNVLSAAAQGTIAALLLTGTARLWHLIALQVLRGAAFSFFFPASQGLVPETVPAGVLQQANALLGMSRNATNVVGAAVGGVLVAAAGPGWALAFDAATYLASALVLGAMRLPGRARTVEAPNVFRELAEGWSEFVSRRWLWAIVAAAGIGNVAWMGASAVYGPLVAKQSLGGAAAWGAIVASEGAGLLLGGLILLRWRPQRPLFVGTAALTTGAIPLLFLANLRYTAAIAAGFLVAGFALELFNTSWATALQEHVPLEKLSRVSSYDALGSFVFIPLGLAIAGPIADAIGLTHALWLAAAVDLGSMLSVLAVREVRELRRLEPVPAPT